MLRFLAVLSTILFSFSCKPIQDASGAKDFGEEVKMVPANANFYCEAKIAKCEYGAGNVFDAGFKRGYALTDFCNQSRILLSSEPFLDIKVCRAGMTRVELVCSCYPARETQLQKDENNKALLRSGIPTCAEVSKRSYNWNVPNVVYGKGDGASGICADVDAYGNVVACYNYTPGDVYYGRKVDCPRVSDSNPYPQTRVPTPSNPPVTQPPVQPYSAPAPKNMNF